MSTLRTSMRAALAASLGTVVVAGGLALPLAVTLVAATPDQVAAGVIPTVLGTVACEPTTGEQIITWTWSNSTSEVVDFDSGAADGSALTTGSLVSTVVGMQPATGLAIQAEAVGETIASADAVGSVGVTLVWFRTVTQNTFQVTGSVLLFGDCVLPETTVVVPDTTTPDTTTAPTVVATTPTTAVGSGGGSLPHAGSDDTLLYIGAGLVLIGGSLLVVRRRSYVIDGADSQH